MESEDVDEPHWVEKLYPPTYTADDVIGAESPELLFRPSLDRVHRFVPLDAHAIRAIYERVLRTEKMQEVARTVLDEPNVQATPVNEPKPAVTESPPTCNCGLDVACGNSAAVEREDRQCLWTRSELDRIRDSRRLESEEVRELRDRVALLSEDATRRAAEADSARRERDDAVRRERALEKKERRQAILCQNLLASLNEANQAVAVQSAQIADRRHREADLLTALTEARAEIGRLKATASRAESAAEAAKSSAENRIRDGMLEFRAAYEAEIAELGARVRSAEEQLALEKASHQKSRLALNQLLRHYSADSGASTHSDLTIIY